MGGNFCEVLKQNFVDKTFMEGGYAAKFAKVFTHKRVPYGMCEVGSL